MGLKNLFTHFLLKLAVTPLIGITRTEFSIQSAILYVIYDGYLSHESCGSNSCSSGGGSV